MSEQELNDEIIRLLDAGFSDPEILRIRRSDFGDGCIALANEPGNLYGVLSYLQRGHWGLELVPIDDAVLVPGWGPALLLGASSQGYFIASTVAALTRERRASQRSEEANDPSLRTARLEAQVAELRRQLAQQTAPAAAACT
jgi:hypothetical protein